MTRGAAFAFYQRVEEVDESALEFRLYSEEDGGTTFDIEIKIDNDKETADERGSVVFGSCNNRDNFFHIPWERQTLSGEWIVKVEAGKITVWWDRRPVREIDLNEECTDEYMGVNWVGIYFTGYYTL